MEMIVDMQDDCGFDLFTMHLTNRRRLPHLLQREVGPHHLRVMMVVMEVEVEVK